MKYTVAWVEIHQETVDAGNEEEAIAAATHIARPCNGSYYTTLDKHTRVEQHNPACKIAQELNDE